MSTEPADRPRISIFIATSVDGFIASPDGGLEWLTGQPDPDQPIYVRTSHPDDIAPKRGAVLRPVGGSSAEVVARLVADGVGHVYVDGGQVIRQFLAAGPIDRMTVSTRPILIGEGIPPEPRGRPRHGSRRGARPSSRPTARHRRRRG